LFYHSEIIRTDERMQYVDARSDAELARVIIVCPENVLTRVVPLIGVGLCVARSNIYLVNIQASYTSFI